MKTTELDSITPYVMPEVRGCLESLVEREIAESAIRFCAQTGIWRFNLDPCSILENISNYDIDLPRDTKIVGIKSLTIDSKPILPSTNEILDTQAIGWRTRTGAASHYVLEIPNTLILDRIPIKTMRGAMLGTVTLKPDRANPKVPLFVLDDWINEIASGAKSKLMLMPSKKWSNPDLAIHYGKLFDVAVSEAVASGNKGHSNINLSVTKRQIV